MRRILDTSLSEPELPDRPENSPPPPLEERASYTRHILADVHGAAAHGPERLVQLPIRFLSIIGSGGRAA